MGAHTATAHTKCVCAFACVCVRELTRVQSTTCLSALQARLPSTSGGCALMLRSVCVQNVVRGGMYLRRAAYSAFHAKLFLINQFMEPGEPRPSSPPTDSVLHRLLSSSGSHNPPSGRIRSYTVTKNPPWEPPARSTNMLPLLNYSSELLCVDIMYKILSFVFIRCVKITISMPTVHSRCVLLAGVYFVMSRFYWLLCVSSQRGLDNLSIYVTR